MGLRDTDALAKIVGPRWAYWLQGVIMEERIHDHEVAPARWVAVRALDTWWRGEWRRDQVQRMWEGRKFPRLYDLKKD
jgi:hypothetical protein